MNKKVVIIGAGITGLSLAHFLGQKGMDFLILEKEEEPGGKIKTINEGGYSLECGPNTILYQEPALKELIKSINLESELIFSNKETNSKRYILNENGLFALPSSPLSLLQTPLLSSKSKWKVATHYFSNKKLRLDNISVYDYFSEKFGESLAKNIIDPFVTGIYAGDPKLMSFKYAFPKLYQFDKSFGNIIKGFIKTRKENPKNEGIFSLKGGLSRISTAIAGLYKEKINYHSEVLKIKEADSMYEIELVQNGKPIQISAQKIIDTRGLNYVEQSFGIKDYFGFQPEVPILALHLGFKKSELKKHIDGFGVLTTKSANKQFLGAIFSSNIFPHTAPNDKSLFTLLIGGSRNADLIKKLDDQLISSIIEEFKNSLGIQNDPEFIHQFLWKNAIPQYNLDHDSLLGKIREFEMEHKNYHLLGNYHLGVSIGDCIKKGKDFIENLKI